MQDSSTQRLVIRHGTLIDGAGGPPMANDALVIEGNRIRSIGPLPPEIRLERDEVHLIDATGHWIMPGLIDGHCHLSFGFPPLEGAAYAGGTTNPGFTTLQAARNAQQVLCSGVTSIAVPGGSWFIDVGLREAIRAGVLSGPRIACAGRFIITYGSILDTEPPWVGTPEHALGVLANSAPEMIIEVRRQCKQGVDFIKLKSARKSVGGSRAPKRSASSGVYGYQPQPHLPRRT